MYTGPVRLSLDVDCVQILLMENGGTGPTMSSAVIARKPGQGRIEIAEVIHDISASNRHRFRKAKYGTIIVNYALVHEEAVWFRKECNLKGDEFLSSSIPSP